MTENIILVNENQKNEVEEGEIFCWISGSLVHSRVIAIENQQMRLKLIRLVNDHDETEYFRILVQDRNFYNYVDITPFTIGNKSDNNCLLLTTETIGKIIAESLFSDPPSKKFSYQFNLCQEIKASQVSQAVRKKEEKVKTNNGKRRKIVKHSEYFEYSELSLEIVVHPRTYYHKSFTLRFVFTILPLIPSHSLPNEIMIEIFLFLSPQFLLRKVNLVNKRFYQLVESEHLYRTYYYQAFGFPPKLQEKDHKMSWREFSKESFKNRCVWIWRPKENVELKAEGMGTRKILVEHLYGCIGPSYVSLSPSFQTRSTDCREWKLKIEYIPDLVAYVGFTTPNYELPSLHYGEGHIGYVFQAGEEAGAWIVDGMWESGTPNYDGPECNPFEVSVKLEDGLITIEKYGRITKKQIHEDHMDREIEFVATVLGGMELEVLSYRCTTIN